MIDVFPLFYNVAVCSGAKSLHRVEKVLRTEEQAIAFAAQYFQENQEKLNLDLLLVHETDYKRHCTLVFAWHKEKQVLHRRRKIQ